MVPRTRDGETNEFNLFPFRIRRHNAYHYIFLNMTIWEVWEALGKAHEDIFNTDKNKINRPWLRVCELKSESEEEKLNHMEKKFRTEVLQEKWAITFGGEDIKSASRFLKYMMLFIIFGSHVADPDYLFDNGNLTEFFEDYPSNDERLEAFNICFGENADWQTIKAKTSKILRGHIVP